MPTEAPHIRKMRITAPRPAPKVRSTAMSRVLSFTIMIRDEITLNAATRMISVRIRNMTFCSTWTAAKKLLLLCCQSTIRTGTSFGAAKNGAMHGKDALGVGQHHLELGGGSGFWKYTCAASSGRNT